MKRAIQIPLAALLLTAKMYSQGYLLPPATEPST